MFEHLILLVGTNPLPNYIVAEYYLKNNNDLKVIYLVHAEKTGRQQATKTQAENLERVLKRRHAGKLLFPLPAISISDVSNATRIFEDINKKLISKFPDKCNVHLNYTGGTKALSVHVYRSIEHEEKKIAGKSFSYLDGRNFMIVDDDKGMIAGDLLDKVDISFEELIALHGFKRRNKDSKIDFSEANKVFAALIDNGTLTEYCNEKTGYNRTKFESNKKRGELAKTIKELKVDELKQLQPNNVFLAVIKVIPEGFQLFDKEGSFQEPENNSKCKNAIKYLDGGWMEDYVHDVLKDQLNDGNTEIKKNWEIDKDGWKTYFELDVILIRGYQLIGISCTTSSVKHICKNKGFEIIHRTRQIGGDEARAVLVTMVDDDVKEKLQKELELNTGITSSNILVLGENDLPEQRLLRKLKPFISDAKFPEDM
jgi:hypothetical protein